MSTKHKYDGDWTHVQMSRVFPPKPPTTLRAHLNIPDGTTGKVEAGSIIEGKAVTSGTASPDGKTLELSVVEPGNERKYFGHFLKTLYPGTADELTVLVGRFLDFPLVPPKESARSEKAFAQNEGDWVLTKP